MDTLAQWVKYLTLVGIAGLVIFNARPVSQLLDLILGAFRGAFSVAGVTGRGAGHGAVAGAGAIGGR